MSSLLLKILFAENDPQFKYLIGRYASRSGFQLVNTSKAGEILMLAKQWEPKVVILDIDTPQLDTSEVLDQLRGDTLTRQIPIILCSSFEVALLKWDLEVDGSWLKPVLYCEFVDTLKAIGALENSTKPVE